MDLEEIIAEIHTLTTGIYYKQLKELLNMIVDIPFQDRNKYKVICKEVVYKECKRITDYFEMETFKNNYLPDDTLITVVNCYELEKELTRFEY